MLLLLQLPGFGKHCKYRGKSISSLSLISVIEQLEWYPSPFDNWNRYLFQLSNGDGYHSSCSITLIKLRELIDLPLYLQCLPNPGNCNNNSTRWLPVYSFLPPVSFRASSFSPPLSSVVFILNPYLEVYGIQTY